MGLTENQRINAALTQARTDLARSRHQREAMAIAQQRGELISRPLITRQAQYIFLCLRQSISISPRDMLATWWASTTSSRPKRCSPKRPMSSWASWPAFQRRSSTPTGSRLSKPTLAPTSRSVHVHRAARRSVSSRRRRHIAGSRRQRRCEDFAPKAEVVGSSQWCKVAF